VLSGLGGTFAPLTGEGAGPPLVSMRSDGHVETAIAARPWQAALMLDVVQIFVAEIYPWVDFKYRIHRQFEATSG
jgi:hypothetical protein